MKTLIFRRTSEKEKRISQCHERERECQDLQIDELYHEIEVLWQVISRLQSQVSSQKVKSAFSRSTQTSIIPNPRAETSKTCNEKNTKHAKKKSPPFPPSVKSKYTPMFNEYIDVCKSKNEPISCKQSQCFIVQKSGDILQAPEGYKAHAVGGDLSRGAGVALKIKQVYPFTWQPAKITRKPGTVVAQYFADAIILNVVCKYQSRHKFHENPNQFLCNYLAGLDGLAKFCKDNYVTELATTPFGCGLDQLEWKFMKLQLKNAFADQNIVITVYFPPEISKHKPSDITLGDFLSPILDSNILLQVPKKNKTLGNKSETGNVSLAQCTPTLPPNARGTSTCSQPAQIDLSLAHPPFTNSSSAQIDLSPEQQTSMDAPPTPASLLPAQQTSISFPLPQVPLLPSERPHTNSRPVQADFSIAKQPSSSFSDAQAGLLPVEQPFINSLLAQDDLSPAQRPFADVPPAQEPFASSLSAQEPSACSLPAQAELLSIPAELHASSSPAQEDLSTAEQIFASSPSSRAELLPAQNPFTLDVLLCTQQQVTCFPPAQDYISPAQQLSANSPLVQVNLSPAQKKFASFPCEQGDVSPVSHKPQFSASYPPAEVDPSPAQLSSTCSPPAQTCGKENPSEQNKSAQLLSADQQSKNFAPKQAILSPEQRPSSSGLNVVTEPPPAAINGSSGVVDASPVPSTPVRSVCDTEITSPSRPPDSPDWPSSPVWPAVFERSVSAARLASPKRTVPSLLCQRPPPSGQNVNF